MTTQLSNELTPIVPGEKIHKHHIIPKHAGGTDDPFNIIELSITEHAEAHRLLFEEFGRWQDYIAWKGLSGLIGNEEIHREKASNAMKNRIRTKEEFEKGWQTRRNGGEWKHSDESKCKTSKALKGKKKPPRTKEHKNKLSKSIKALYDNGQMTANFPNLKGTKWWNNGTSNKRCIECPGDEWILGRFH
jgi:hypothetical protein